MLQLTVPIMDKELFSRQTGIDKSGIDRLIKDGVLPEIKLSPRKFVVNLALLTHQCLEMAQSETELRKAIKQSEENKS
ncbi:MAG: hypothetical protein ISEC1_P2071 [Thiomicrorhabdus sp.]|nr:MAG: hypothetical protein ISEC1_P2071 [Thiomicrorhabdus sp.]